MKQIFDVFAFMNCIGCVVAIVLIVAAFIKEDLEKTQPEWNAMAFACVAFNIFGFLRETYSLLHYTPESVAAWPFKFTTSGIFIISIMFYRLSVKVDRLYKTKKD